MPFPMCWLKIGQNEDLLHNLKNFAKFLFILNDKKNHAIPAQLLFLS